MYFPHQKLWVHNNVANFHKTKSLTNNDSRQTNFKNTDELLIIHFSYISFLILRIRRVSLRVLRKTQYTYICITITLYLSDFLKPNIKITSKHKTSLYCRSFRNLLISFCKVYKNIGIHGILEFSLFQSILKFKGFTIIFICICKFACFQCYMNARWFKHKTGLTQVS